MKLIMVLISVEYHNARKVCNLIENTTFKDYNELKKLIDILHKHNLLHYDLHGGNVLVECKNKKKIRFYLNDFGLTKKKNIILKYDYDIIKDIKEETIDDFIKNSLELVTTLDIVKELVVNDMVTNNLILF